MLTHIIYHVVGRKVGCTKDPNWRQQLYLKHEGVIPKMELLEELYDRTDQEAGDIEWAWADQFGYRKGVHYTVTMNAVRARARNGGIVAGSHYVENTTFEQRSKLAKKAANKSVELGVGVHGMTTEQLSENGKRAARIGHEHGGGFQNRTKGQLQEIVKKAHEKLAELKAYGFCTISAERHLEICRAGAQRTNELGLSGFQQKVQCPHCGKIGGLGPMSKYHLDKCPHRPRPRLVRRAP